MSSLQQFLSAFRVDKGHEFSHTSLGRPAGSYYLPSSSHTAFLAAYTAALDRGEDVHLTERHRHVGPVIVDLDFRYEPLVNEDMTVRRHAPLTDTIVGIYARAMATLFQCPAEFDVYVTEKPRATMHKGLVKDGLHLLAPEVVTRSSLQLMLRRDVLGALTEAFQPLGLANRVEDVVDEAVIERNNWMMYGSKKGQPDAEPYLVTRRYRHSCESGVTTRVPDDATESWGHYVELFSIRNKYDDVRVRDSQRDRAEGFLARLEEERKRREAVQRVMTHDPNPRANTCEDLDLVCKLVSILDDARVATYNDWVRLGWCLRNIDHRLLDAWVEVSKRSDKYVEGECPRLWQSMRAGGLGIGTLHMWARQDAPERYREILRLDLVRLIKRSANASHYDVASVVHHLYQYEFVCCSIRNRTWYEFRGHRWHECDTAYALRRRLSIDVFDEYGKVISAVSAMPYRDTPGLSQAQQDQEREKQQKENAELTKKLADLQLRLKTTRFKDDVMKECGELFYHEKFESKLDSDINLLGFENGVFDLEQLEFREGRPDDYISFSTGINYVPYVEDHPTVRDIRRFWESVHPDRGIREYVLKTLASCLSGAIREERFHIWTGSGCHAAGTRLLRADGAEIAAEDVAVGDRLLGDDGRSARQVVGLCRGHGDMYRVTPVVDQKRHGDSSFVVNGEHVLSLRVCGALTLAMTPARLWRLTWLERSSSSSSALWQEASEVFNTAQDARAVLADILADPETLKEGDILDVTVRAYLTHLAAINSVRQGDDHLRLYRPGGCGCRFEPETLESAAVEVIADATTAGGLAVSNASNTLTAFDTYASSPDPALRRALLAGVLQASRFSAKRRSLAVSSSELATKVVRLARSVGLGAWPCHAVRSHSIVGFGDTPESALESALRGEAIAGQDLFPAWLATAFVVERVADGDFYGFELDATTNRRYLMADFVATHNSNGKSLSVSLFEKSLGQYCCKFPVTLLTQKRAASSSATPEIARAKGRRFAVLQEPSEDERLNVGQLKELSGGDTVQTRELFKAPCEWRPQFKLFLLCNQLPNVPSDDGGTWRRIRVVEFGSKFMTDPNPEKANEFPIDMELGSKIDGWKEHFMAMLINYYKQYIACILEEPDAVTKFTREYQRNNDHMADFVDSCIEKDAASPSSALLLVDDAFQEFKEWVKSDGVRITMPKKAVFQRNLDRTVIKSVQIKGRVGYRGYKIKDRFAAPPTGDDEEDEGEGDGAGSSVL
jgi:P4 family phage/plasmid primase-like protien